MARHDDNLTFEKFKDSDAELAFDIAWHKVWRGADQQILKDNLWSARVFLVCVVLGAGLQQHFPHLHWSFFLGGSYLLVSSLLFIALRKLSENERKTDDSMHDSDSARRFWNEQIDAGTGCLWFAKLHGEIIGTIGFVEMTRATVEVRTVYVSPEHRGKKLSSRMMEFLLETLKAKRYKQAKLRVTVSQPAALGLYKKFGFCLEHVETMYFLFHLGKISEVHMVLNV